MDRKVDEADVAYTERTPEGIETLEADTLTVEGSAGLDRALNRSRNFTVEGRGEEIPAPAQAVGGLIDAATVEEVEHVADTMSRNAADVTGRAHCAAEVLAREQQPPLAPQPFVPEDRVMQDHYTQEVTRLTEENIATEIRRDEANRPNMLTHMDDALINYVATAGNTTTTVTNTNGDFTYTPTNEYLRTATHIQPDAWTLPPNWHLEHGTMTIGQPKYFCPSCGKKVTSKVSFVIKEEEGEESFDFCTRCIAHALHQMVPKLRPIPAPEMEVANATVTYTPQPLNDEGYPVREVIW